MSQKYDRSLDNLKNESARQRWQLFHRAIASAKQSNTEAMRQAEDAPETNRANADEDGKAETRNQLSIAR